MMESARSVIRIDGFSREFDMAVGWEGKNP